MEKTPTRKCIRMNNYDYSTAGAYFVTICIDKRKPILWAKNTDHKPNTSAFTVGAATCRPKLSYIGTVVEHAILQIQRHYPMISVDKYCIMPDHIHMIIVINTDESGRQIAAPTISTILGQTKRWTSMKLGYSIWQKSFYDHVIRNYQDYRETWEYIENNPLKHLLKQSSQIL